MALPSNSGARNPLAGMPLFFLSRSGYGNRATLYSSRQVSAKNGDWPRADAPKARRERDRAPFYSSLSNLEDLVVVKQQAWTFFG